MFHFDQHFVAHWLAELHRLGEQYNVRAISNLLCFAGFCIFAGAGMALNLTHVAFQPIKPDTSTYLAMNGTDGTQSQAVINMQSGDRLTQLEKQETYSADDRKEMHDQIYKLEQQETAHYNELKEQIDVGMGWLRGIVVTFSSLLAVLAGISTFMALFKRQRTA
jgi:hypothetical protein